MDRIEVFTDGGCSGNPGPGGWAFVILKDGKLLSMSSGGDELTTNNKMELTAVINALKTCMLIQVPSVVLYTDSQYVKGGITEWIFGWKKNGWRTSGKKEVKNQELWQQLDSLNSALDVSWNWVKGHAGVEFNELCDSMVRKETEKFK